MQFRRSQGLNQALFLTVAVEKAWAEGVLSEDSAVQGSARKS